MKNYTDWAGNVIQEGDTLVLVRTKPVLGIMGFFIPSTGVHETIPDTEPPLYIWQPVEEFLVRPGYVVIQQQRGITNIMSLSIMMELIDPRSVVCIKGKSDNETEYYLNYFNDEN